ncbi:MAG: tetratricopeptide repeat protein [Mucilaginibacter sp.]
MAFYITSPLLTIFHELGHALAYLALTKPGKIDVFIGSYGNKSSSFHFRISKLNFYIRKSFPFIRSGGSCQSDTWEQDYIKNLIILLAGPFFTVIASCLMGIIVFNSNVFGLVKLFCFACIIFSVAKLYINLKPNTIKLKSGREIDNDGKQIAFMFRLRKHWDEYIDALKMINQYEYPTAINTLESILQSNPGEERILELLTDSLLQERKFNEALFYYEELEKIKELSCAQLLNRACAQSFTGSHEAAIKNYREVLNNDSDNNIALHNLAYSLAESGDYIEAEDLLKMLLELNPEFVHTYGTLGYLKILNGELDEGKSLIEKSLVADPNDAYAYKALGIYHFKKGSTEAAESAFKKAKECDNLIDLSAYSAYFKTDEIET